jgi:hypothetical protein
MANVRSRRSRMSTGSNTTMHMLSIMAARRGTIDPLKRARVQERHWAHFVSAIRLHKSSPSRTMPPKPAAGLPTEVVNDKGRYR